MNGIAEKNVTAMSQAAALSTRYLEEALSNVSNDELADIQNDIEMFEYVGTWSARIIDIMKRARCLADADQMLARFEAAA